MVGKQQPLQQFSRDLQVGLIALYCVTLLGVLIYSQHMARVLVIDNLYSQVYSLIKELPDNGNQTDLIRYFRGEKGKVFFRITLLTDEMSVLYDSLKKDGDINYLQGHYKFYEALHKGYSYDEHFSSVTLQDMAYINIHFNYGGSGYFLRSSFPLDSIQVLQHQLKLTFFLLSSTTFLIFSILTWLLIQRLNRPLESVLKIVSQKGTQILDPTTGGAFIELKNMPQDFNELVNTLNGLAEQVNQSLKTLAQERNEREAILRSMVEGVISLTPSMEIIYANPAAYHMLEISQDADLRVIFTHPRFDQLRTQCQNCYEKQTPINEETDLEVTKKRLRLDVLVYPGTDNNINMLIRDNSQQYELSEMRRSFVANASHELRTPITIIRGFAETLFDHPDIPAETVHDIMKKIVNNCERMNSLITQLMNLSKIENLPITDLSILDLGKVVQQVIDQMSLVHPSAVITFERALIPANILGQETLLSIVIKNLIENAVKYSDSGPKIHLDLRQESNFVQLTVQDHGIGIPENDLPYIFERFYTVDKARSKKIGGYGLGLSMVKTIIDKHKGTIHVESLLHQGTCFTLRFMNYSKKDSLVLGHAGYLPLQTPQIT